MRYFAAAAAAAAAAALFNRGPRDSNSHPFTDVLCMKMNLSFQSRLIVLSLSLIKVAHGSYCTLCANGNNAPLAYFNTNVTYGNTTLSCGAIDSSLQALNSTDPSCTLAQSSLASVCGCSTNSTSTTTMCPGICSNMAYPNRAIPPIMGLSLTCAQAHGLAQTLPANDPTCAQVAMIGGQYCGCPNAPPSCTPCYSNTVPTNFTKTFTFGGQTISCSDFALATTVGAIDMTTGMVNQTICNSFQDLASLFCGCPRRPNYCSVCTSSQKLNSSATFNLPSMTMGGSCAEGEVGLNVQTSDCPAILYLSNYTGIQSQCCVKSASSRFLFSSGWAASAALFSAIAFLFM